MRRNYNTARSWCGGIFRFATVAFASNMRFTEDGRTLNATKQLCLKRLWLYMYVCVCEWCAIAN